MFKPLEVTKDIYWVGTLDPNLRVFDIIMYTEYGTTYNAYVVKGSQKTALFETAKAKFSKQWLERLSQVTSIDEIDYVVLNHTEPDHTGSLVYLLEKNPNITVVGTGSAIRFLGEIANRTFKSKIVKDGDSIDLGDKTVKFIIAPFLHWPDTMYSYIPESETLITCDSFGCHYCDEKVFNDQIEGDFVDAYKYYFDMIMGPFKSYVLDALKKIKDLDIDIVCPGHGPVLRTDLQKYFDLYREWATVALPERLSIVIPYVSAYGYTAKLAQRISEGIKSVGDIDVYLYDMVEASEDEVLDKISTANGILFGSPTIVGDALAPIWSILIKLNPVIHKGKLAGAFGSYGWSGEAVPNIEQRLKQLRLKIPVAGLRVVFNPSEAQLQEAFEFGASFGDEILIAANAKKKCEV